MRFRLPTLVVVCSSYRPKTPMHSFSRTEINKIHLIDAQSCSLKVICFCSQTPQTLRPTPHVGKNLLLGTAQNDTYVPKIRKLRPETTGGGLSTPRSAKLGPPTKTDRADMPGGHQLARFLKKKVTRISLGLSLKTEKSTVKADKGAVVDNRQFISTRDINHCCVMQHANL